MLPYLLSAASQSLTYALGRPNPSSLSLIVGSLENLYIGCFPLLQVFVSVLHPYFFSPASAPSGDPVADQAQDLEIAKPALEFLPLMATSVYCAVGLIWSWLRLSYLYIQE
jgi:alpha-1,3-glucosyltransferase